MKRVVQYKMHGNNIPYFIENGGHFPDSGKLVGITKDDTNCFIPADLVTYDTKESLSLYVSGLQMIGKDKNNLSSEQKIQLANAWWDANV